MKKDEPLLVIFLFKKLGFNFFESIYKYKYNVPHVQNNLSSFYFLELCRKFKYIFTIYSNQKYIVLFLNNKIFI